MIKLIFGIIFSISILLTSFPGISYASYHNNHQIKENINKEDDDIEYVEYICVDSQWFKITHYTDGSIGVTPVNSPPLD